MWPTARMYLKARISNQARVVAEVRRVVLHHPLRLGLAEMFIRRREAARREHYCRTFWKEQDIRKLRTVNWMYYIVNVFMPWKGIWFVVFCLRICGRITRVVLFIPLESKPRRRQSKSWRNSAVIILSSPSQSWSYESMVLYQASAFLSPQTLHKTKDG